jgi:hypothetical protein
MTCNVELQCGGQPKGIEPGRPGMGFFLGKPQGQCPARWQLQVFCDDPFTQIRKTESLKGFAASLCWIAGADVENQAALHRLLLPMPWCVC